MVLGHSLQLPSSSDGHLDIHLNQASFSLNLVKSFNLSRCKLTPTTTPYQSPSPPPATDPVVSISVYSTYTAIPAAAAAVAPAAAAHRFGQAPEGEVGLHAQPGVAKVPSKAELAAAAEAAARADGTAKVNMHACIYIHIHIRTHFQTSMFTPILTPTHILTDTHTHTHTPMQAKTGPKPHRLRPPRPHVPKAMPPPPPLNRVQQWLGPDHPASMAFRYV